VRVFLLAFNKKNPHPNPLPKKGEGIKAVETSRKVFGRNLIMAVYTHIDTAMLEKFLTNFNIGTLVSFLGIADGVSNTNYLLHTTQGRFILTLFEDRVNVQDIPFYLDFMAHLQAQGLPCPAVLGRGTIAGKHAVITSFLNGKSPQKIEPFHCAVMGETLAGLHTAAQNFTQPKNNDMGIAAWRTLITACGDKTDSIESGLYEFLMQELLFLEQNLPSDLPRGVVHADLFPDNVFFDGEKLTGIIDFYFACSETLVYDLMLTLNAWCFEKNQPLDPQKSAAFLNSYHQRRPLTPDEQKYLPFFGRAAALRIIATRLYDRLHPKDGAVAKTHDPMEHVAILRFHQSVTSLNDYGFKA
jgi:homoserine kinase type II